MKQYVSEVIRKASLPSSQPEGDNHYPSLEYIFHPRSIAVVGASSDKYAYPAYVQWLLDAGYEGNIYPVNPSLSEMSGLPAYPNIRDVPSSVDHVISCLPSDLVPQLIEDCGEKGVKVVQLYTARMAETGENDRIEAERDIARRARRHGIRIIGPNCLGIFSPGNRLSFMLGEPREVGSVGYLAQSGGHAADLVCKGAQRGIRFSKVVSYGNAADLNECDFLEYFIQDPQTEIIAVYIEGVREGQRFINLLRQAAAVKPIVVFKGGRTATGARAAASHTASLAGVDAIWEALFRQTGLIMVESLEEMADVLLAFSCLGRPRGRRVACVSASGGMSVFAADECERAGLIVPQIPPKMKQEVKQFAPDTWLLINNPVDGSVAGSRDVLYSAARLVGAWDEIDILLTMTIPLWAMDLTGGMAHFFKDVKTYIEIANTNKKPMAVVMPPADVPEDWKWKGLMEAQSKFIEAGFPVYPSLTRATRAIGRWLQYHGHLSITKTSL